MIRELGTVTSETKGAIGNQESEFHGVDGWSE